MQEVVAVRVGPTKLRVAQQVSPKVVAQCSGIPIISRGIGGDAASYTGARVVAWAGGFRGRCYPHDTGAEGDLRGHELAAESVVIVDVRGRRENRSLSHREEGEPLRPPRGRPIIILLGQVNYLIHEDRVRCGGPIVPILSEILLGNLRKPLINRGRWQFLSSSFMDGIGVACLLSRGQEWHSMVCARSRGGGNTPDTGQLV
jgi:hypothetical protein